jgi:HAD superfamily hydrolase (TIGR01549 family)
MQISDISFDSYDVIILDCDGVVFDSNNLKIKAFESCLKEYGDDKTNQFIKFFKKNFGTSRFSLTKHFIEEILSRDFDPVLYDKILSKYSAKCKILYSEAKFTEGCEEFLKRYARKKLFIASGSDQTELRRVFNDRQISNYFCNIFGSPVKKVELVKSIVEENSESSLVMIGDAKSDFLAANASSIDFIYMQNYSTNQEFFYDINCHVISNLGDL